MSILRQIFETLREYYAAKAGCPWWSENPIEAILSAILVQGSTWSSVEKALDEFRTRDMLDLDKIVQQTDERLAEFIRPVGFQSKKAGRIRAIARFIHERSGGDLDRFFARDVDVVRKELLSIPGIGPGTADNILLYAGQMPVYMVDTFTVRVLIRHGIADTHANELQIQELIHRELTPDEEPYGAKLFQKMQELLIRIGRDFCDKSRPDCFHCPLSIYLPEGGALELSTRHVPVVKHVSGTTQHPRVTQSAKTLAVPQVPPKQVLPVSAPRASTSRAAELPLDLTETERKIVEAIGGEPMPIDDVITTVRLPVHIVRATIAVLQMKKLVRQVEGNQVQRS